MSQSFSEARLLSGHKDSITCLIKSIADDNVLCSGSDDTTVRIWDLRSFRSTRCICSCFENKSIEAVSFSNTDESIIFACAGNMLYTFDLRYEGLILKGPISSMPIADEDDEVHCISLQHKGEAIAMGCDDGSIAVVPLNRQGHPPAVEATGGSTRIRKLSRYHNNLVSGLCFKPNSIRELVSGGFDCNIHLWDYNLSRPQASFNFSTQLQATSASASDSNSSTQPTNILNPPFVHSVQYAMQGRMIAAALGNGSISLHSSKDLKQYCVVEGHAAMATCLHAADDLLLSGGADRRINLWRIKESVVESVVTSTGKNAKKGKEHSSKIIRSTASAQLELADELMHGRKINAIAGSKDSTQLAASHFAVADTSPAISIYSLVA